MALTEPTHTVRRRALRVVHRTIGHFLPPGLLARTYPDVPGRVHLDDQMLRSDAPEHVRHYLDDARSAMANIEESLAATGRTFGDIASCLDFACGYGRLTRHLVRRLGADRVTACDVDRQAVRFCARELGAVPLVVPRGGPRLALSRRYDLVFVGSLLTHLPPAASLELVESLAAAIESGGQLIFSTQGESCLRHLDWYGREFLAAEATYRDALEREGVGFVPYRRRKDYGITIHARWYVETVVGERLGPDLALVRYRERSWDEHQDVWSYARAPG